MRALSHCDFCGADAAGTFELLPPELEPTEAEQRRVVLCRACGDQLEDLLEPLLARAGVDSTDDASPPAGASETDTADEESPQESTQTGRPSVIDVDEAKTNPGTDEAKRNSGADDPESDDRGTDDSDGGITLERSPDSGPAESETPSTESSDATADSGAEEPTGTGESTDTEESVGTETDSSPSADDTDSSSSNGSNTGSTASPPQGYAKVVRLLRNREFPMDRSAVETLAAGAYDLETREVEAIIEYALEDGEFAEKGDQLVRS